MSHRVHSARTRPPASPAAPRRAAEPHPRPRPLLPLADEEPDRVALLHARLRRAGARCAGLGCAALGCAVAALGVGGDWEGEGRDLEAGWLSLCWQKQLARRTHARTSTEPTGLRRPARGPILCICPALGLTLLHLPAMPCSISSALPQALSALHVFVAPLRSLLSCPQVAVINTKLPEIGELLLHRVVTQASAAARCAGGRWRRAVGG